MHIKKIVNKAKSVIGWIKRSLISRNRLVMINVYKTLVRPHVEYAVQLWNLPAVHGNWNHIMELEDVQRSFTRLVEGIELLPYKYRLKELQLTTLLERRMRGDIIETFKLISRKVDYGKEIFRLSRSKANILKDGRGDHFLSNRLANYWNKIPGYITEANTVSTFKLQLQKFENVCISSGRPSSGQFRELSETVLTLSKTSESNHDLYVDFMIANPNIANRRGINC